jgi:hypothetical protein
MRLFPVKLGYLAADVFNIKPPALALFDLLLQLIDLPIDQYVF